MPWYVPAFLTAALWGLLYVLAESATKGITKTSYLLICTVFQVLIYSVSAFHQNRFAIDLQFLWRNPRVVLSLSILIAASIGANYLSLMAIQMKNASAAASVETTYPLWAALFAYLIFGQVQLTPIGIAGTVLVMFGICLVVFAQV